MKVSYVVLGTLFTLAGFVTLLVPAIPFICYGALIFGPIMVIQGLVARDRPRGFYRPPAPTNEPFYPPAPLRPIPGGALASPPAVPSRMCANCGSPVTPTERFCARCGASLPEVPPGRNC